jgi:hypothetical protein
VVKDVQSIWQAIVKLVVGVQLKPTDVSVSGCNGAFEVGTVAHPQPPHGP